MKMLAGGHVATVRHTFAYDVCQLMGAPLPATGWFFLSTTAMRNVWEQERRIVSLIRFSVPFPTAQASRSVLRKFYTHRSKACDPILIIIIIDI